MGYGESNNHMTRDVPVTQKGKGRYPIILGLNISKKAKDSGLVLKDSQWKMAYVEWNGGVTVNNNNNNIRRYRLTAELTSQLQVMQ